MFLNDLVDVFTEPLRGRGYQFWSGIGGDFGLLTITGAFLLRHNCYTHRCWRIGRIMNGDGHLRCKKHAREAG